MNVNTTTTNDTKYAVLGTGMVGKAIATKLTQLHHQVYMGSRTASNASATAWQADAGELARAASFAEAAAFGDIVFNCTSGANSMAALATVNPSDLDGKILVDVANPLDVSNGMPVTLTISNTDSLGETIQRAFPNARVVKTLNTVNCEVMVDPSKVPGDHDLFICGDSNTAKAEVTELLERFGWRNVNDIGDIVSARATEQLLPLWLRLYDLYGSPNFNFRIVRGNA